MKVHGKSYVAVLWVILPFRYGREDEELMGLRFCNEIVIAAEQLHPSPPRAEEGSSLKDSTKKKRKKGEQEQDEEGDKNKDDKEEAAKKEEEQLKVGSAAKKLQVCIYVYMKSTLEKPIYYRKS